MNSPKLSATTTPKLVALLFQSAAEAMAAPTSPMAPSGPIGIRSPGSRNASAIMAAMAVAATQHIGTMAMSEEKVKFTIYNSQFTKRNPLAIDHSRFTFHFVNCQL